MCGKNADSVLLNILAAKLERDEPLAKLIEISFITNRDAVTKLIFRKAAFFEPLTLISPYIFSHLFTIKSIIINTFIYYNLCCF